MKSLKLFGQFFSESYKFFLRDFPKYLGSYLAFVFIDILAAIPWAGMGYESNSFYEIVFSILVGILSLIVIVNVILIEKAKYKHSEKEALLYSAPTYLIYTLYVSLIMLAGFLCFIIPGIVLAICFGMVPLASVLIDNDSINYFKISYRMARKDAFLIFCFGVSSLLIELPSLAFDFFPDWRVKLGFNLAYSVINGVVITVLTITSVRVFYHLKKLINDPS